MKRHSPAHSREGSFCEAQRTTLVPGPRPLVLLLITGIAGGCGLFEPRDPEEPSQSSLNNRPPTEPSIVIANLQSAVEQRNPTNYVTCFSDEARGAQPFIFIPSADAAAAYGGTLSAWTLDEERSYFQNLVARSGQQAYASLTLNLKTTTVTSDSVVSAYDYILVFEHSDPGFRRRHAEACSSPFARMPATSGRSSGGWISSQPRISRGAISRGSSVIETALGDSARTDRDLVRESLRTGMGPLARRIDMRPEYDRGDLSVFSGVIHLQGHDGVRAAAGA